MKYCPDCSAPNPLARTECFSCGQSLHKKAAPLLGDDLRTFPCANCAAPVSFTSGICSGCGREAAPPLPAASAPFQPGFADAAPRASLAPLPPLGWEMEPLPDGKVTLRRTFGGRLLRDVNAPALLFCVAGYMGLQLFPGRYGANSNVLVWAAIAVLTLLAALLTILWAFSSRETLVVGPNSLIQMRRLGTYERTWRITGQASLRVRTRTTEGDWSRYGSQTTRTLSVQQGNRKERIDFRIVDQSQFGISHTTLPELVSHSMGGEAENDDMGTLASYLSAQTGWPIVDDRMPSF